MADEATIATYLTRRCGLFYKFIENNHELNF
jgi:hypothetical protein